jgi:hypothetical protein
LSLTKRRKEIMRLAIALSTILLAFSVVLFAQVSPEEAQQRMLDRLAQEKLQAEQAAGASTQPSQLTNGEVAALKKTIVQQQNEIAKLTVEVQKLKTQLAISSQSLHTPRPSVGAQLNESPDGTAKTDSDQETAINTAIEQHQIVNGMTVEQAGKAVSLTFRKWTAGSDGEVYIAFDGKQVGNIFQGTKYTLEVQDGRVTSWSSEPFAEDVGTAGVRQ